MMLVPAWACPCAARKRAAASESPVLRARRVGIEAGARCCGGRPVGAASRPRSRRRRAAAGRPTARRCPRPARADRSPPAPAVSTPCPSRRARRQVRQPCPSRARAPRSRSRLSRWYATDEVLFIPAASAICRIDGPSPCSVIHRRTTARICSSRSVRCSGRRFKVGPRGRGPGGAARPAPPESGPGRRSTGARTDTRTASVGGGAGRWGRRAGCGERRVRALPVRLELDQVGREGVGAMNSIKIHVRILSQVDSLPGIGACCDWSR